jgi:hypothetical protein
LRVLIDRQAQYELITDEEGLESSGFYYPDIVDVLEDDTADEYEKTRSIVELFNFPYSSPVRDKYSVFVFDDNGALTFTGYLDDD